MSSCSCSNAEGLSLLDGIYADRLYNTYNPPKVFIPLTTQLMYKVNNPVLQQTVVQNAFTQPTFSQEATLNSVASTADNLTVQESDLLNNLQSENNFTNSLQTGITTLEMENNPGKDVIDITNVASLSNNIESEAVHKLIKNNDNNIIKSMKSLAMLKKKIDNKERVDDLLEYAQIWDKLICEKEQSKDILLDFRTKALEIFGDNTIDHFENNIGLNDSYKDVLHLSPKTTAQSTLAEFYKSIAGNAGEVVYMCIKGSNVQKAVNGKCSDGFKLHKYSEPFTIDPTI